MTQAMRIFLLSDDNDQGLGYNPSRDEHVMVHLSYTTHCLEDPELLHGVQGVDGKGYVSKNTRVSTAHPCGG